MGLFDKVSTDGTGNTNLFIQQAVAFAKLDLNTVFKMSAQGVSDLITNAIRFFDDVFGHSDCNQQDRVLVERFCDQIPGMWSLTTKLGYWDSSVGAQYEKWKDDPAKLRQFLEAMGRPKGAHPCNELIYPARLLFTILFGVRITNSNYLDALERGVDDFYASGTSNLWDIPRNAVERAVMLRQQFFPGSTYNTVQWDLNRFQEFPLVAPVPDPVEPGVLYTGEFLGVQIVNGMVIGDPLPDVQEYVDAFDAGWIRRFPASGIMDIRSLPTLTKPATTTTTTQPTTGTGTGTGGVLTWVKAHPLETVGLIALLAIVGSKVLDD